MPQLNFLWICIEDTGPTLGCYGDPVARTPNLDKLARQGRRYNNAFATAPVCAPSRNAVITGMYQSAIGGQHMRTSHTDPNTPELPTPYDCVPPPHVKAFSEYLRAAGYFCANDGRCDYQFKPPFTMWDENDKNIHWWHRAPNQPFFVIFSPLETHESKMWPQENEVIVTDPAAVTVPPYLVDTLETRKTIARHYDNLETVDRRVGQILARLEADGLAGNTVVMVWSDHGNGLPRGKRWPYDSGTRVPLIVRWPGQIKAGENSEQVVSMVDLGPTLLSLAGVAAPEHLHGQPFLGPDAQARKYCFSARDRMDTAYDKVRAVRDERYRYIRNFHPEGARFPWLPYANRHPAMRDLWSAYASEKLTPAQAALFAPRGGEELYDLQSDPFEINNLAADSSHAATLQRMSAALDEWRREYDTLGDEPEDQMAARFWPDKKQPQTSPPFFAPIENGQVSEEPRGGGALAPNAKILVHCATQGASIGITFDAGKDAKWQLYTAPLAVPRGKSVLRAKAIRYGYAPSDEVRAEFEVS